ncbi:hypothetical protein A6R68_22930 [Neotoma lepida]|uniref:Interleukin-18 n=1 Tax=Neotoma lepida TaxID=56216 RepID=A0A1A6HZD4_NEOLE|nr:hypothetical protein A6R68_22930 [Neotoma lepida]
MTLLDPHPDCKLSGSPCSLYSRLPSPAADRAACHLLRLQCQEEERSQSFQITSSWRELSGPGRMMAAVPEGFCINFREMIFIDNTLYFMLYIIGDLESDHFARDCSTNAVIRNMNDHVLFIDRSKQQPVFEDMTDADQKANESQTKLIIYIYKDDKVRGLPVTLSVKDTKMFTLSCKNKVISFEEMNPPENIDATESDLIFFQRGVPGHDKMQFESSLYEGHFLACEKDGDCFKLTLKEKDKNGDKSIMFTVTNLP